MFARTNFDTKKIFAQNWGWACFYRCSYFFWDFSLDVLIKGVLIKWNRCIYNKGILPAKDLRAAAQCNVIEMTCHQYESAWKSEKKSHKSSHLFIPIHSSFLSIPTPQSPSFPAVETRQVGLHVQFGGLPRPLFAHLPHRRAQLLFGVYFHGRQWRDQRGQQRDSNKRAAVWNHGGRVASISRDFNGTQSDQALAKMLGAKDQAQSHQFDGTWQVRRFGFLSVYC